MSSTTIRKVTKVDDFIPIKTALISVYDKSYLNELIMGLGKYCPDLHILSTGGTYSKIKEIIGSSSDITLQEVSDYTGFPEVEGGLVKTINPKIALGILAEKYCQNHQDILKAVGGRMIDLTVVNLYPFSHVIRDKNTTPEEARGNIDIGGVDLLRSSAKNYHRVMTLAEANLNHYRDFINSLEVNRGCTNLRKRFETSKRIFKITSDYDYQILEHFRRIHYQVIKDCYELNNTI